MNGANILKGVAAGFAATFVLSALMVMKSMVGLMPELDVIAMISKILGASLLMGWIAHFMIGTAVWGGLFVWLAPYLPGGSYWLKGVIFGVGAWLMMMIAVMPMAGAGLFGISFGMMAPVMTLVLHIIFGVVLGGVYGAARPETAHGIQNFASVGVGPPEREPGVAAIAPQKMPVGSDMTKLWLLRVDGGEVVIRKDSALTS